MINRNRMQWFINHLKGMSTLASCFQIFTHILHAAFLGTGFGWFPIQVWHSKSLKKSDLTLSFLIHLDSESDNVHSRETQAYFFSLLPPPVTCKLKKIKTKRRNKKMAEESKRTRNKAAGVASFTQDKSIFYVSNRTALIILISVLQPRRNWDKEKKNEKQRKNIQHKCFCF